MFIVPQGLLMKTNSEIPSYQIIDPQGLIKENKNSKIPSHQIFDPQRLHNENKLENTQPTDF